LKIRFQADANIDPAVRRGVVRREPTIDFQTAAAVYPDGTPDDEVLRIAAEAGRILVTADLRTMSRYFQSFIAANESPGILLIPSSRSIGAAIEGIVFIWRHATPSDLRNRIQWLP
jgi:hypothetical protein